MPLESVLNSIEALPVSMAIAESDWMFPTLETVHVAAIAIVLGSIAFLDLRLLGVASRRHSARSMASEVLPWTWGAFSVALLTGLLMFISSAVMYFNNLVFWGKMLLLLLAGLNMAIFHLTTFRSIGTWQHSLPPPPGARAAALVSLSTWIAIAACGRWIGFV